MTPRRGEFALPGRVRKGLEEVTLELSLER